MLQQGRRYPEWRAGHQTQHLQGLLCRLRSRSSRKQHRGGVLCSFVAQSP